MALYKYAYYYYYYYYKTGKVQGAEVKEKKIGGRKGNRSGGLRL